MLEQSRLHQWFILRREKNPIFSISAKLQAELNEYVRQQRDGRLGTRRTTWWGRRKG